MSDLVTLETSETWAMGTWRHVMIMSWRKGVTMDALQKLDALGEKMWAQFPKGYASVSITFYKTPIPDDATRKLASSLMKKAEGRVLASVNVIEGEGFWAGTARSVVAAINFGSSVKYPLKVVATADEGARFIAEHLKLDAGETAQLVDAVARFRAQHAAI